ncbi:MAG: PadR family transcriptional regulator [Caldilineaceae bacterium]|nr:PadR family transcriptional regulator [Caldilineaceae bacterium]
MSDELPPLPTTSYAVLGLLSFGEPLSGYEIRKWAENMRFFYWPPAQSQIYSELRRLSERGFVESAEVVQTGKPDKRLYCITPTGEGALRVWLEEERAEPTIVKNSVALKLFFGHMTRPEVLAGMLERFVDDTQQMLGQLAVVQKYMENEPKFAASALVTEWGCHHYNAEAEMTQRLLARLRGQLGTNADYSDKRSER